MAELFAERWRSPSIHEIGFKKWTYWATLCQAICLGDKLRSRRFHIFHGHGNHLVKLNLTELGPWWMVWGRPCRGFWVVMGPLLKNVLKIEFMKLGDVHHPRFRRKTMENPKQLKQRGMPLKQSCPFRCTSQMLKQDAICRKLIWNTIRFTRKCCGWNMVKPKNENAIPPRQSWIWERNTSIVPI